MTKYKEYVQKMFEVEHELFDSFRKIHDSYHVDQDNNQQEFNKVGEKVLLVITDYENKLCASSERGGYGNFTTGLAEKFRGEIKRHYPMLDRIGLIVEDSEAGEEFVLKKIDL